MSDRFYKSDGLMVPSGTTVLPRPYLAQWSANCAVDYIIEAIESVVESFGSFDIVSLKEAGLFEKARKHFLRESREAADYGTYIHTLCEYSLVANMEIESPHKLTQDFMSGFWKWVKKHNVKPIAMEHEVLSKWYGGRLDLVCEMDSFWMTRKWCEKFGVEWYEGINKQRVIVLVDFKTGKGAYYETWKYQLAGYRQAWNEERYKKAEMDGYDNEEDSKSFNWGLFRQRCKETNIQHHGVLKFNKDTGKVNYKDFTVWETTRTVQDSPRLTDDSLRTEKYIRTYETDRKTFNDLVSLWWSSKRGITI